MGLDNEASKPPPATQNEGGLDATIVDRKIGADPAIVGTDNAATETASALFRSDLHSARIPESAADARSNLHAFRADLAQGEGVGKARTTMHSIEGRPVFGTESTNAEGVTTFYAPKGDRSWTVNTDGTYTPIQRNLTGDAGVVHPSVTGTGDRPAATATSDGVAATPEVATVRPERVARQFEDLPPGAQRYLNDPQVRDFLAAHPQVAQGERTVTGSAVTYKAADGSQISFEAGGRNNNVNSVRFAPAGATEATQLTRGGEPTRVPLQPTVAPAATGDTRLAVTPGGEVRAIPVLDAHGRPVIASRDGGVTPPVVAPVRVEPAQPVRPAPGQMVENQGNLNHPNNPNNPFNRAITEAFGAQSFNHRTGQLTMPDGSVQQLDRQQLREQYKQFQGQGQDVGRLVDSIRQQQQQQGHVQVQPGGQRPELLPGGQRPELLPGGQRIGGIEVPGQQRPGGNVDLQQILRQQEAARLGQLDGGQNPRGLDLQQQLRDMQGQRFQQFQQDMHNPLIRAQMLDAMRQIQSGNLQNLGTNGQRMADIMKEIGLDKAGAFKNMLENPQGQLRFDKLDQLSQAKLANFMDLMQGKDPLRLPGIADSGRPLTPVERLADFLRLHERVLDKVPTGECGKAFFMELNKILKDVNAQFALEPGKGLTATDIIGRRLQDGRMASELGLLPGLLDKSIVRPELRNLPPAETFGIKLNPGEQMAVRMMQLQQELAAKTINPSVVRMAEQALAPQMTGRPLDVVLQTARQFDPIGLNVANTTINHVVRELSIKDAATNPAVTATAANMVAGRDFNASVKIDPAAMKSQDAQTATKAQQDAVAAAVQQFGMRIDPGAVVRDAGLISQPGALDATGMTSQNAAAAMKALEEEQARCKKKEEEEENRLEKEQDTKEAAMAALLAARKRKELKDKEEQEKADEKDKKEPERRVKYIVKEGDTLESIATKMLRDKRLAALIYEINKAIIPVVMRKGKEVVALRPKMVIWLPTTTDVKEFRGRLQAGGSVAVDLNQGSKDLTPEEELAAKYGDNWEGNQGAKNAQAGEALEDLAADAVAGAKKRRENIEKLLGPLKSSSQGKGRCTTYLVRLGDTLKSVAMKHPLLQDVTLWKLLAEVNDLTSKTDEKGHPMASLRRGTAIAIPTNEEIDAYRARDHKGERKSVHSSGTHDIRTKNCGGCGRATIVGASICPGCFRSFDEEVKVAPNTIPRSTARPGFNTTRFGGAPTVPASTSGGISTQEKIAQSPATQPVSTDDSTQFVAATPGGDGSTTQVVSEPPTDSVQLSELVRVSRSGEVETTGLKLRLEMRLTGSYWLPVVAYEIFQDVSLRHEYTADGSRKTVRIDLPPQAAKELAENDITSNHEVYCDKFASTAR
jgi:hypothetical protein